jgi:hypothetical protein
MNAPTQPAPDKNAPTLPSAEEALRVIEEYAGDLREIIKKFRRKLN